MRGKRMTAITVTGILLLLSLTRSLSALDVPETVNAEVAMNPLQMSVFKASARQKGMDVYETARAILRQVGYPEGIIQAMPADKLLQVADSRRIETKEEYVCISPGGVTASSKAQYEAERNISDGSSGFTANSGTPSGHSWAKLQTWVMQGESNRTAYSYSAGCTWLTTPVLRMQDYIALGVTAGSVNPDSTLAILTYKQTDNGTGRTTQKVESKSGQNQIEVPGTTANAFFNLPNDMLLPDVLGHIWGNQYTDFSMMLWLDGTMTNAPVTIPMYVVSAYFHQTIATVSSAEIVFGDSGTGASFSVSPKYSFHKIINNLEYMHSI